MARPRVTMTWPNIRRAAGLTIVFVVIALRATNRLESTDAQVLLGIATGLLGLLNMLARNGKP